MRENPSGNTISAATGRSVIATSNSASPNSQTKLHLPMPGPIAADDFQAERAV
jgi:hypothetical protein